MRCERSNRLETRSGSSNGNFPKQFSSTCTSDGIISLYVLLVTLRGKNYERFRGLFVRSKCRSLLRLETNSNTVSLSRLTWIYKHILNLIPLAGMGDPLARISRGEGRWSNPEGLPIRSIGRVNLI